MSNITLRVFTDPACPWAYSAEPTRWRLRWLYGDQISWQTTMIILSGYQSESSSFPLEKVAKHFGELRERFGMPIDDSVRPRMAQSIEACRSVVGVRRNAPESADALLRQLRIAAMGGKLIDEQSVLDEAATKASLDPSKIASWAKEGQTETELTSDAEAARTPTKVGMAFRHKLSKTSTDRVRYSAPSYQFIQDDKIHFELPGFWPVEASEAAIGNIVPDISRRPDPESVKEVLEWAQTPLATVEVARVCAKDVAEVRKELQSVAEFTPMGQDGFWRLK
jgi:predicted DsbA family dithiol-disulfide isomerase